MFYEKEGHRLEEADKFMYTEEISLRFNGRFELYSSKTYVSDKPVSQKQSEVYNDKAKCYVCRSWEMEAAPIDYLKLNGYKLTI